MTICVCIYTYIGTYYFGASGHTHIAEHARAILTHPFLYASIFLSLCIHIHTTTSSESRFFGAPGTVAYKQNAPGPGAYNPSDPYGQLVKRSFNITVEGSV